MLRPLEAFKQNRQCYPIALVKEEQQLLFLAIIKPSVPSTLCELVLMLYQQNPPKPDNALSEKLVWRKAPSSPRSEDRTLIQHQSLTLQKLNQNLDFSSDQG